MANVTVIPVVDPILLPRTLHTFELVDWEPERTIPMRAYAGRYVSWVEIWDEVEAAGGERLACFPALLSLQDKFEVQGREILTLAAPWYHFPGPLQDRDAATTIGAWPHVLERRVLRIIFPDLIEEWRILRYVSERSDDGSLTGMIECESIALSDLNRGITEIVQANGLVEHAFELYNLTPAEHLAEIISMLNVGHFQAGVVEPTDELPSLIYQEQPPLAVLRALAEATRHEIEVIRELDGMFTINLVEYQGAGENVASIRSGHNLRSLRVDADATEQNNRIYPLGAQVDDFRHTMAEAQWRIIAADGGTGWLSLEFTEDLKPIAFEGQLDDLYLENAATETRTVILESDPVLQRIRIGVGAIPDFGSDSLVHVRRDNLGTRLTYLDDPASIADLGLWPAPLLADDVPGVDNFLRNPFLNDWAAGAPIGWSAINGALLTQISDGLHAKYGNYASRVLCAADGEGIESDWVPIIPTSAKPHFTAQSNLWVAAGVVRFEIIADTPDGEVVLPPIGSAATTSVIGTFVEDLGIAGIDFLELEATRLKVRLVAHGGIADFYADAFLLTQTAGGVDTFYYARASNVLWRRALDSLEQRAAAQFAHQLTLADLYRLDTVVFDPFKLSIGAAVSIVDESLQVSQMVRAVGLGRDHLSPLDTTLELGVLPKSYLAASARAARRRPPRIGRPGEPFPRISIAASQPSSSTIRVDASITGNVNRWDLFAKKNGDPRDPITNEPILIYRKTPDVSTPAMPRVEFPVTAGEYTIYARAWSPDGRYGEDLIEDFATTGVGGTVPSTPVISYEDPVPIPSALARPIQLNWINPILDETIVVEIVENRGMEYYVSTITYSPLPAGVDQMEEGDFDADGNPIGNIRFGWGTKLVARVKYSGREFSAPSAPFYIQPHTAPTITAFVDDYSWSDGPDNYHALLITFDDAAGANTVRVEIEVTKNGVILPVQIRDNGGPPNNLYIGESMSSPFRFEVGDVVDVRMRYWTDVHSVGGAVYSNTMSLTVV